MQPHGDPLAGGVVTVTYGLQAQVFSIRIASAADGLPVTTASPLALTLRSAEEGRLALSSHLPCRPRSARRDPPPDDRSPAWVAS